MHGVVVELAAARGDGKALRCAQKERLVELLLQLPDVGADSGLRGIELCDGLCEAAAATNERSCLKSMESLLCKRIEGGKRIICVGFRIEKAEREADRASGEGAERLVRGGRAVKSHAGGNAETFV